MSASNYECFHVLEILIVEKAIKDILHLYIVKKNRKISLSKPFIMELKKLYLARGEYVLIASISYRCIFILVFGVFSHTELQVQTNRSLHQDKVLYQ